MFCLVRQEAALDAKSAISDCILFQVSALSCNISRIAHCDRLTDDLIDSVRSQFCALRLRKHVSS